MLSYALELPTEYAWAEFWIISASFLILVATVCWGIYKRCTMGRPAKLDAWFLEKPVLEPSNERYSSTIRVPSQEHVIVYHLIETKDERELQNVSAIVKYPDEIEILFLDKTYRNSLQYGRKVISRGKHEAEIVFDVQTFVEGQKDKLPFPLVLDTSHPRGKFPVTLSIVFSGIRTRAVERRLEIDVCESDFSYDRASI